MSSEDEEVTMDQSAKTEVTSKAEPPPEPAAPEPEEAKESVGVQESEEKGPVDAKEESAAASSEDRLQPSPASAPANALATLAAEAVKAGPAPTDGEDQNVIHPPEAPKMSGGMWHSVGIFSGNSCKVTGFTTQDLSEELRSAHFDISKMPASAIDELAVQKLEPGEFYRFRVRAFNSCGFGPWSEVTTFRTTVPGFPSPPSGVKITSTKEGVHLSWHPPQDQPDEIIEYSVYLAVKGSAAGAGDVAPPVGANQMAFKRVYIGAASSCLVPSAVLTDAHVTTTASNAAASQNKPAILFRIAARNKKGYGPSIQVRWLQGESQAGSGAAGQNRRPAEENDAGSPKKRRKD